MGSKKFNSTPLGVGCICQQTSNKRVTETLIEKGTRLCCIRYEEKVYNEIHFLALGFSMPRLRDEALVALRKTFKRGCRSCKV